MKCPFLVRRNFQYDKEGRVTGEELEIQECIKTDCMVYDGATKLCSLLATNMKNGVLIDDLKKGVSSLKDEIFQRGEATGVLIATTVQTFQDALVQRLDIIKKQNEVIALAFDRLTEITGTIVGLVREYGSRTSADLEAVKNSGQEMPARVDAMSAELVKLNAALAGLPAHTESVKNAVDKVAATLQVGVEAINGQVEQGRNIAQGIAARLEILGKLDQGIAGIGELMKTEIAGIKSEGMATLNELSRAVTAAAQQAEARHGDATQLMDESRQLMHRDSETLGTIVKEQMAQLSETLSAQTAQAGTLLTTGFGNLAAEMRSSFVELTAVLARMPELFAQTQGAIENTRNAMVEAQRANLESVGRISTLVETMRADLAALKADTTAPLMGMNEMLGKLNHNYLESLSKIAGLAEGMRKGVEQVGVSMNEGARQLVAEMKQNIADLEKQYEQSFRDIAELSTRFESLSKEISAMTGEIQQEFRESFERQARLTEHTKGILEHMKSYFDKEEVRHQEEQEKTRRQEALDHFDRSSLYYYRGNYGLAHAEIEKALEIDRRAEYLNLMGLILTETGKTDEARKAYEEAIKLEPAMSEIHNNLGLLYFKTRKLEDAVASFQEAIKHNVNYSLAYVHLGKALMELEKFDEAMKAYGRALEIDPANRAAKEAIELYREGKIQER